MFARCNYLFLFLSLFLFGLVLVACSNTGIDDYTWNSADDLIITYDDSTALNMAIEASQNSKNRNKTVGIFGGSIASNKESIFAIRLWCQHLGMKVKQYGSGGSGFAGTQESIEAQVDRAKKHDIYILWASTNDYTQSREIGEPQDYTEMDGFNQKKRNTQCGGMNYCIQMLRRLNPKATIYVFGSIKFFEGSGYEKDSPHHNEIGKNFYSYIVKQKEVADFQHLSFFNQFDIPCNTLENSAVYYKDDKYHLTEQGYANIGVYQLYFLATEKEITK